MVFPFFKMEVQMTIRDAIARIDDLKPNSYSTENKVKWLSDLDERIKAEVVDTHEGADAVSFKGYNATTSLDTELLASAPYDEVYIRWLEAMIDYANAEIPRYNNSISTFQSDYTAFANYYNRRHKPLSAKLKFF